MDLSHSDNLNRTLTIDQAAQRLSVSTSVLLQWNELNILKPTIMQDGELVYSEEQIDKFLEIQRAISGNKREPESEYTPFQAAPQEFSTNSNMSSGTPILRWLILSFSGIVVAIILVTLIQQGKIRLLPSHSQPTSQKPADNSVAISTPQTSKTNISQSTPLLIPAEDKPSTEISHTNADLIVPENNNGSYQRKFEGINFANNRSNQGQVLSSTADKKIGTNVPNNVNVDVGTMGYSEIANLSANIDKTHDVFDDSGNLKGETTGTDVLATLGMNRLLQVDNPLKPATSSNVLLLFAMLGSISIILVLKKQFAYPIQTDTLTVSPNFSGTSMGQRVLEVDQKMDGTVVLYFQDKEYKLCKPELDSESDQFIDRLMELSDPNVKEIDYDRSYDKDLKLSTPLSKLVTRLGFTGMKRSLFFPRTSKNKVLFRRYITKQDLVSMNLNSDTISKEFPQ